ncbi:methionine adenosyltransferase [Candidatus Micrarchaeota archaeon CG10_big_fil_rev_8_21_14_0_10_45_29]|nr:MAG: methionine adenosyltransferase [Candidatus Micrarchaeota archaeon CG10_big_fil_rev_8_21_14_0_10_45_29]
MVYLFTSEAVTEGHPDKICDLISDAILDEILKQDKKAHVAVETAVSTGLVMVLGEVSTSSYVNIHEIVQNTIKEIGYTKPEYQFDYRGCGILVGIKAQSPDIAQGVKEGNLEVIGAGDQGIMFGYACTETPELMPLPISLANKLAKKISDERKTGKIPYLRPDGKVQITVQYSDSHEPQKVTTVVIAQQHDETHGGKPIAQKTIESALFPSIKKILGKYFTKETKIILNGTGKFVIGGPASDTGMTGRKIIADTYGGMAPHGGGCFSGKDPTKVDRSANYMARYIAKNIVAAKLAKRCTVQLGYVIGMSEPVSVWVDTHGTGKVDNNELISLIKKHFRLKPGQIIADLNLRQPIYKKTACYGHFGRDEFSWEKCDKADALSKEA